MQRASSSLITKKPKNAKKNQTLSLGKQTETFRSKSVVKQKGMAFGFRKTATTVTRPER
jgi:hypothetical protein